MSDEPLQFLITGFLLEECACFITGLSGHGKTLIGLSLCKAFINQSPLFGNPAFEVTERIPCLYLIPESGEKSFKHRLKKFGLVRNDDMFLCRTLSDGAMLQLNDERLLEAAKGRVVVLDTAIRFTDSADENSAAENKYLSRAIFLLLQRGARSVIGLHHSPKKFETAEHMSLENAVRGNGDIGAMLGLAYAIKLLDPEKMLIQVECVKPRDIEPPPQPFQIQGRPCIDETGDFVTVGACLKLSEAIREQNKQKRNHQKEVKLHREYLMVCRLFDEGLSNDEVKAQQRIGSDKVSKFRSRWEQEQDQKGVSNDYI
jgi:hypothetical protein